MYNIRVYIGLLWRQKTSCYTFWLQGGLCMQDEHQFYLFDDSTVQDACSNDLRNHWCLKLPAVRANKWGSSLHHHRHHRWEAVHKWTCNIEQLRVTQEDDKRWRGGTKKRWWMMKNPRIQGNPSKKGRTGLILGQMNGWWWFLVKISPRMMSSIWCLKHQGAGQKLMIGWHKHQGVSETQKKYRRHLWTATNG